MLPSIIEQYLLPLNRYIYGFADITGIVITSYSIHDTKLYDHILSEVKFDYCSGIEDVGAMVDFDYNPSPGHSIKFGGKYLYHNFKPGITAFRTTGITDSLDINFGNKNIYAHELYVYAEDNIKISNRLSANLGLHYSIFSVQDELYNSLQPVITSYSIHYTKLYE